ncbi:transcriptional regulator, AraC family [Chromohalobacter canadensis]|uniref:Transcriptional regulator, AraC family n=1 Tax=Chromohalobacter canadensis TaxID=141389 RepID=A0A285VBN2_9GAMM|nr:AraC family transcriptional regulator [Chromohalobacter canadensis]SOC50988.1 transcriptional regulator, AraC family [Chromohalobacter canadensis]
MSNAYRIFQGGFGRIALLDMDEPLVPHAHSECHVLIKATGQDTYFSVRGRRFPLTDNTAVLVNAWEPHYYDHQVGVSDSLILALYIEPRWLAAIQTDLSTSARPDFFSQPCVELTPHIRRQADILIGEMLGLAPKPREEMESLIFNLLISIMEKHSDWHHLAKLRVCTAGNFYDARIRRATELILQAPPGELEFDIIARQCNLSRAHFFSLFKKTTGMTPQMLANMRRMQSAFDWLAQNRQGSLGELSIALGFPEQGHFTRFFRRHIGAAPSQYQRVMDDYSP